MASRAKEVTKLIQDAILKICSQYVEFQKSLEIDGIICLSPGEFHPDIVVKMHRTVLQPKFKELASDWHADVSTVSPIESPDPPAPMTYNYELYNPHPRLHTSGSKSELPSQTFQDGGSQSSYTTEEGQVQSTNEIRNVKRKMIMDYNTPTPTPEKHAKMDHIEQITIEQDNYEDNEYTDDVNLDDSQSGIASNIGDIAREYQTADLESKEGGKKRKSREKTTAKRAKRESAYKLDDMIRVHISENQQTGEQTKMFRCVLCLRDFVDRSNIRQHVRIHTGEKPYTCVLCNQAFTQSSNLKRHVNLRHLGLKENKSKLGKAEQLLYTNKFQGDLSQMVSQAVSSVQSENLSTAGSDNLNQSSIPYQNQSDIENMYPPSSQDLVQYKPDSEGDKYQLPPEDSVPSIPENSVKYEPNPDNLDKYQSTPDDSVHSNSETTVKCEPNLENSLNSQPNPESSVKYEPNSEDSVEYQQNPESSGKYQTNPGDLVEDHVNFEDPNSYANSTVSKAYLSNPEDTNTKE